MRFKLFPVVLGLFFFQNLFAQEDFLTDNPEINRIIRLSNQNQGYATRGDSVWLVASTLFEDFPNTGNEQDMGNFLVSKKVLKEKDLNKLDKNATKGFLAQMIMRSLGLKGGLAYSLFGSGHYAFRECQFRNIMPSTGSSYQKLTGPGLLSLVQVARSYQLSKILNRKTLEDITEAEEEEEE